MSLTDRRRLRGEFFTPLTISSHLVQGIESSPNTFLDLGAGRGSLSSEVIKRWQNIKGTTVEIDDSNYSFLQSKYPDISHFKLDILSEDFISRFRDHSELKNYDLIVSNPPFMKILKNSGHQKIFKDTPLEEYYWGHTNIDAELVFIHQALELLREGSEMAVIVPDYIITSSKSSKIRSILVEHFGLYKTIELPQKSFSATDVKTHLIFLKPTSISENIRLKSINKPGEIIVTPDEFKIRGDYKYFANSYYRDPAAIELGMISSIRRGNLPIHLAKTLGLEPFHTTDFSKVDLKSYSCDHRFRTAIKGDILMARVGRNLSEQIQLVENSEFNVSDCVFIVSVERGKPEKILDYLISASSKSWFEMIFRGSGARSISLKDLAGLPIPKEYI